MIAFAVTSTGHLIKMYSDIDDIQVKSHKGESWCSISGLNIHAAIKRALDRHCDIYNCAPIIKIEYVINKG